MLLVGLAMGSVATFVLSSLPVMQGTIPRRFNLATDIACIFDAQFSLWSRSESSNRFADRVRLVCLQSGSFTAAKGDSIEFLQRLKNDHQWLRIPEALADRARDGMNVQKSRRTTHSFVAVATGWPFRAFTGTFHLQSASRSSRKSFDVSTDFLWMSSLDPPPAQALMVLTDRASQSGIPFRPIPAGLLLDAILMGLAPFTALCCGLACLRRLRRHRCSSCGYPLLESQTRCPECGVAP